MPFCVVVEREGSGEQSGNDVEGSKDGVDLHRRAICQHIVKLGEDLLGWLRMVDDAIKSEMGGPDQQGWTG